jgi:hypothetical protein
LGALEWRGEVRLAIDRAEGISAERWQEQVRVGLFERAVALGAAHRAGPHMRRPEVGRRLLAHVDALGEAGAAPAALLAFAQTVEMDRAGVLWVLTLLFGCLKAPGVADAFEGWLAGLDPEIFASYQGVVEVAEALAIQPNPALCERAERWLSGPSMVMCAIAIETLTPKANAVAEHVARLALSDAPIVQVALERLFVHRPELAPRAGSKRASWADMPVPALSYQVARARILQRDMAPLQQLRARHEATQKSLGSYAIDVFALAGGAGDDDTVGELLSAYASTDRLLRAAGRVGLPQAFARLLADLENADLDADAHEALTTALGPRVLLPSRSDWERVIAALPATQTPARLRGGNAHSPAAIVEEMRRPELSTDDVRVRADEVFASTGRRANVSWCALGETLDVALRDLGELGR